MIVILPKPGKSLFDVEEMVTSSGTKLYGLIGQFFSYKYVVFTKKNLEIETLARIAFKKKFEFFREIATMK